jgi:hypothetical protein
MRLNEFMHPSGYDYGAVTALDDTYAFIQKNCGLALDILRQENRLLFRGVPQLPFKIFVGQSENNRPPKNTKITYQKAIDNKLKLAGFKALRSNSIFVTNSLNDAKEYGSVIVVFPFDSCHYTWSSEHYDLTTNLGIQAGRETNSKIRQDILTSHMSNAEFIDKYGFRNGDLEQAIRYPREIYINGQYVAIPYSKTYAQTINNWVNRKMDHNNHFTVWQSNHWPDATYDDLTV